MDCFRITSPSIASLGTLRRRLVPLRTTIWQISCYLHSSMFLPPVPKRRNRFRAVLFLPMRWKRNTRSYICSGLHKMYIRKWLIVPWDFTSMGFLLKPVLQTNGLVFKCMQRHQCIATQLPCYYSFVHKKCHFKTTWNMYGNRKYLFRNKGHCYVYTWEGVTRGQLRPIDLKSSIILSYLWPSSWYQNNVRYVCFLISYMWCETGLCN